MAETHIEVPELAEFEVDGLTRSAFLARSTLAVGAVYGVSAIGPFVGSALGAGDSDVDILNFALTLEYIESEFYRRALRDVPNLSSDAKAIVEEIQGDEAAHIDALITTIKDLGGKPVKQPKLAFGSSFKDEKNFLKAAVTFEDTGVAAYNGAGPAIKNKDVLGAAGSIVQVEGRHAALVRGLDGQPATVGAFDKGEDKSKVEKAVAPFIKS